MRNSGAMTDKQMDVCIKNIASGDMAALRALYDELRIPIYKFALSIVRSTSSAEDIAQETFLRIRAAAPIYRSQGKPRAWIFSIVRNLSVTELRRMAKSVNLERVDMFSATTVDSIEVDGGSLLDLLKADEKEIVSLHVLADLKHIDIARTLNIPYEQVRWKYAYAIKKLRKHLTKFQKREGVPIETEKKRYRATD